MSATNANDRHYIMSGKFLDTAGGTSAITYSIRLRHGRGATCNITSIEVELIQITITI